MTAALPSIVLMPKPAMDELQRPLSGDAAAGGRFAHRRAGPLTPADEPAGRPGAGARQPILNLPPVTAILLVANLAVHGLRLLLPEATDARLVFVIGFIPARYTLDGAFGWSALVAPFGHQFLHGGVAHLLVNMAMLMAFGAGIERRIGGIRMLAFAMLCGVVAVAAHAMIYPSSAVPVIGASGAISGLFGGVVRFMPRRGHVPAVGGLWPAVLLWIGASILFGLTGLPGDGGAGIAWVAHIGGFLAGLALFPLFDRRQRR